MRTRLLFLLILFAQLFAACSPKREVVTQQNLRDVLTRYGKANPETKVRIETEFGNMQLRLYEDTPLHRANFVKLIKEGQYEDADFYRVFYRFMIQGGSPDNQFPYRIPAEFNKKYFHK